MSVITRLVLRGRFATPQDEAGDSVFLIAILLNPSPQPSPEPGEGVRLVMFLKKSSNIFAAPLLPAGEKVGMRGGGGFIRVKAKGE